MFIGVIIGALILWAQSPVKITDGNSVERVTAAAGAAYNSGMTTLPGTLTVAVDATIWTQFLYCGNIDTIARTVTVTDNQSTPKVYLNAVSISANGVLTANFGSTGVPFANGVKWQASTTNAINCVIIGVKP